MLISAGDENGFNMMTASWGFMGEMWGNDSAIAMIRPQRYTWEFIEKNDYSDAVTKGRDLTNSRNFCSAEESNASFRQAR